MPNKYISDGELELSILDRHIIELVIDTLHDCQGNQSTAAKVIGMSRGTFRKYMKLSYTEEYRHCCD